METRHVSTPPDARIPGELPSPRRLLRSTIIALVVAVVILVTMVLPAEYGVDPTGIGRVLGLTQMSETKMALAREEAEHAEEDAASGSANAAPAAEPASAPAVASATTPAVDPTGKSDVTDVTLAPNQSHEIKLVMQKDARVTFAWSTDGGVVNFDTHGDSPTRKYHGYGKGTAAKADTGVLVAAFDGNHGWFWRNRGTDTVTVTLRTSGAYQELKRMP